MDMKEALTAVNVAYDSVLNRFCNNEGLLRKFLLRFPSDNTFQMLKESVDQGNMDEVERHAHTLKGVAANLGFDKLSAKCAEVVWAVRQQETDQVPFLFSEIAEEYRVLVDSIQKID